MTITNNGKNTYPSKFYCVTLTNQLIEVDHLIAELNPYTKYWVVAEDLGRRWFTSYNNEFVLYNYKMLDSNGQSKNITFPSGFEVTAMFDNTKHANDNTTIYRIRDKNGTELDLFLDNMKSDIHSLQDLFLIGSFCFPGIKDWQDFRSRTNEEIIKKINLMKESHRKDLQMDRFKGFWIDFANGNDNYLKLSNPMFSIDNRKR